MHPQFETQAEVMDAMRIGFTNNEELEKIFVTVVKHLLQNRAENSNPVIVDDPTNVIQVKCVRAFLTCLSSSAPEIHGSFLDIVHKSVHPTFLARLRLIFGGADWMEIGDRFWLTPGLDLILNLLQKQSILQPECLLMQSMHFDHNLTSINLSEYLFNSKTSTKMKTIVKSELHSLYNRYTMTVSHLITPLIEWMYYSPKVTENIWLQLYPQLVQEQCVSPAEHHQLLYDFSSLLMIDTDIGFEARHLQGGDVIKTLMKSLACVSPAFVEQEYMILVRAAFFHSAYFEALDVCWRYLSNIQQHTNYTTKWRAKRGYDQIETYNYKAMADVFVQILEKIGEHNISTVLWKTRATYNGTIKAFTFKQLGLWDRMQHQLWNCQIKMAKKLVFICISYVFLFFVSMFILCLFLFVEKSI